MANLTKAEILWTRKCPLNCSFCAMKQPIPRAPTYKMIEGLHRLKNLDCRFIAIYGASPLHDFEGLPKYIKTAEDLGILTTIITDGIVSNSKEKIEKLYHHGLRSLTVSYDFVAYDNDSKTKTEKALPLVHWFNSLPNIRDVEIVATVTSQNYKDILQNLKKVIDKKIWFSFDFIHPDRKQSGTKCRGDALNLLMKPNGVKAFCKGIQSYKSQGFKIHPSNPLLQYMVENPNIVSKFQWNCSNQEFPSWITIDADGTVLPCDDFYTSRQWKVWNLDEKAFSDFTGFYRKEIKSKCPGCFWTTHYDAWLIKKGYSSFDNYVHKY